MPQTLPADVELTAESHASMQAGGSETDVALDSPPPFDEPPAYDKSGRRWWNFRTWSRGQRIETSVLCLAIIIAIVVVVPVEVEKKINKYPEYSYLEYYPVDTFYGTGFFDNFHLSTDIQSNTTSASSSSAVLRVSTKGDWKSAYITSKAKFSDGLFIFDIIHTPTGCGTWPTIRLTDPSNSHTNGEIFVMSAIQTVTDGANEMLLDTSAGCSMKTKRKQTGKSLSTDCFYSAPSGYSNYFEGCVVESSWDSFGTTLNSNGGVLMALELRSEGIRIWEFPRASIPDDITVGVPDPSSWPKATADFPNTHCDIGTHFQNQSIVIGIEACGPWVDDIPNWNLCGSYCSSSNATFSDAYWEISTVTVYDGAPNQNQ